ncbi:MAG: hypothetical protein HQL39_06770 [Alphaproteobacteria bacterium]|nr:hypothetical protein [Alphaproteobacteria bacterium]
MTTRETGRWLMAICAVSLVAINIDPIWLGSVDLAHHYALVERLSEKGLFFHLPEAGKVHLNFDIFDLSLGEMNYYPPASHLAAAILGRIFDSSLIGMQLVALLALAGVWMAAATAVFTLPPATASIAGGGLIALLALNRVSFDLPAHGGELVAGHFFAQLVGQSLCAWAVIAWAKLAESGAGLAARLSAAAGLIAALATVHMLSAVIFLGFFACSVGFDVLREVRRPGMWRSMAMGVVTVAAAAGVAVLHPSFRAMTMIAGNDGDLDVGAFSDMATLAGLCVAVLALAGALLTAWARFDEAARRGHAAVKYLALYGAATALLCLCQIGAMKLGYSNAYSCKKYVFSLISAMFVLAPVGVALIPRRPAFSAADGLVRLIGPAALVATGFHTALPEKELMNLSKIVPLERQLKMLNETYVPWKDGGQNIVAGLLKDNPTVDYMFSLGILKAERLRYTWTDITHMTGAFDGVTDANVIVTMRGSKFDLPACRRFSSQSGMTLVNARCAADILGVGKECVEVVDFSEKGLIDPHFLSGFSTPEAAGRWTEGVQATFRCRLPEGKAAPSSVTFDVTAFLAADHGLAEQRLSVGLNGAPAAERVFRANAQRQRFEAPLPAPTDGEIVVTFDLPDSVSPAQLGFGGDTRRLGVYVHTIVFRPPLSAH